MLIRLNGRNDSPEMIKKILDAWNEGEVVIIPTDSVYAFTCHVASSRGIEKISGIQGIDTEKHLFSMLFADFSMMADYIRPLNNYQFRLLKKIFPGPYTVILEAHAKIYKTLKTRRRTIGIRIPNHPVTLELLRKAGHPVFSSSVHDPMDEITDYLTDPEQIDNTYGKQVRITVDGGYGNLYPTTVLELKEDQYILIREGLGSTELF